MSDIIHHECGVALIRLLKPLEYYKTKYGSSRYGIHKLYQIMEKMINRGQDGAGVATIKLDVPPGTTYLDRMRSVKPKATQDIFGHINRSFAEAQKNHPDLYNNPNWQKENIPFLGELLLGHLRYGTFGKNGVASCHPFKRQNNWQSRNLVVAGNFNLTNVDELFTHLLELGQHPVQKADTVTVMEKIGHFLDKENDKLFKKFKEQNDKNYEISKLIQANIDVASILRESSKKWDGGYVMCGMMGHGDAFVLRDPNGIRPAYFYKDDEVIVVASERPVIQTVFNVPFETVNEVKPGHALIIKKDGSVSEEEIIEPGEKLSCSFERIYFSRGNDKEIYKERINLGKNLTQSVLKSVDYDLENTVFSYIPNTAEIAFAGLVEGLNDYSNTWKAEEINKLNKSFSEKQLKKILDSKPRVDKVVLKEAKQRTFITDDESRDSLVNLIYDVTYGTVKKGVDNLVVLDDSIVRGTTLKQSILKILDRLEPKKIVVVSSAPQIRYPDCYGIDMAVLKKFVAFEATIALLKENGKENFIREVYERTLLELEKPKEEQVNMVKEIYSSFSDDEISKKIASLIKPKDLKADFELIYQTIEGLHTACPDNRGDWYFSGNFPTPGGNKVSNQAFVNYIEGNNTRAY
ncbi:amidophosphoribosyltransferase [Aurantibacillus circumpalustris]|uniref:amidophosphoribosyltransferase n=1 Tax=Aurantibacillus circumpalustris TaxID=3036359 RepID=UPI00295C2452|nr:amidophosphoribosyltransferase [Aurantibacillus circumpalustris]